MVDWKNDAISLLRGEVIFPRVRGLFHSNKANRAVPTSNSARVIIITNLEYTESL